MQIKTGLWVGLIVSLYALAAIFISNLIPVISPAIQPWGIALGVYCALRFISRKVSLMPDKTIYASIFVLFNYLYYAISFQTILSLLSGDISVLIPPLLGIVIHMRALDIAVFSINLLLPNIALFISLHHFLPFFQNPTEENKKMAMSFLAVFNAFSIILTALSVIFMVWTYAVFYLYLGGIL